MAKKRSKPAAKKAAEPKQEKATEAAKPSEVRQVISGAKLKSLLSLMKRTKENVGEIAGATGSEIKTVCDKFGFSKRVLRYLAGLNAMTPEKLALELEDLKHGLEVSGLNDRAKTAPTMGFQADAGEDDEEAEEAPAQERPDNIVRHPSSAVG